MIAQSGTDLAARIQSLGSGKSERLQQYESELSSSGILDRVSQGRDEFNQSVSGATYRGCSYGWGGMLPEVGIRLFGLIRELRPKVLVETGVCNGVSTAVVLAALRENGGGSLYSIDFPEYTDTDYEEGTFWSGKLGAAVPKNREPGWIVPAALRENWSLTIGRTLDELPPLLTRLGTIDFFLHDSEHSYECMSFEYRAAWPHLCEGGVLASDDIRWNDAFTDFGRAHKREVYPLAKNLSLIIK